MSELHPLLIALLFAVLTGAVVFALQNWLSRRSDGRINSLGQEKLDGNAEVSGQCMVREGFLEEPGVAQIASHQLSIWTLTGRTFSLPLEAVRVSDVKKNNWLGRYPWWKKTLLHLEAPGVNGLVVGFNDAEPWLRKLNSNA